MIFLLEPFLVFSRSATPIRRDKETKNDQEPDSDGSNEVPV